MLTACSPSCAGVDVNTIFATLDPGAGASTASVGTSAGVAPGGAGMQAGVLPQQQQQQLPSAMQAQLMQQHQQHQQQHQPLPSMAAAMNATAGGAGALATPHMPGAAAATPPGGGVLPVGGGAGYGAAQGMQPPPQQQQLGMVPVGAAGGYGAVDANVSWLGLLLLGASRNWCLSLWRVHAPRPALPAADAQRASCARSTAPMCLQLVPHAACLCAGSGCGAQAAAHPHGSGELWHLAARVLLGAADRHACGQAEEQGPGAHAGWAPRRKGARRMGV